jgi:hypothetical protein
MKMKPAPKTACCLIKKKENIVHLVYEYVPIARSKLATAITEHRVIYCLLIDKPLIKWDLLIGRTNLDVQIT